MEIREEEFDRAIAGLTRAMEVGFSGVHSRLDKVNGRLDRHDDELQDLQITRARQQGRDERGEDDKPLLTNRDGRLIKTVWALAVALAGAVAWILSQRP